MTSFYTCKFLLFEHMEASFIKVRTIFKNVFFPPINKDFFFALFSSSNKNPLSSTLHSDALSTFIFTRVLLQLTMQPLLTSS